MATNQPPHDGQDEARRILARVEREGGIVHTTWPQWRKRVAAHFAARDGEEDDDVEKWGRRIGRALGFGFLVVLVLNLFTRWFF